MSTSRTWPADRIVLERRDNQARGLGQYAIDMLAGRWPEPAAEVYERLEQLHRDSVACGVAALGCGTNAPRVLRAEALRYGASAGEAAAVCLASERPVAIEKAVLANCAAVRELDANGTNFGYDPSTGATRGEFGHNDWYPVAVAGAAASRADGRRLARAMLCLDEIRGRLAEVFALRVHKIDHVLHGAIASAAVYGALRGATAEQIESAIGLVVAHYVPFRAIRAGHQLSDSKGASAALSAEVAVTSVERAMRGFRGPADVFRNPQAVFCLFEPPEEPDASPFDLALGSTGSDFAVMGMHFKLGIYEHQSAGALQALFDLLERHPSLVDSPVDIEEVSIAIYEPALSIIGDPAKRDPRTRQSADHSMVYIMATALRKALERRQAGWKPLMLMPSDYDDESLFHPLTRRIMERIRFTHGGPEYDARYPDGIPTSLAIRHRRLGVVRSPLVMYPEGHARNQSGRLAELLDHKFERFAGLGVDDVAALRERMTGLQDLDADAVGSLYRFSLADDRTAERQ